MKESTESGTTANNATAMHTKAGEDQFLSFLLGGEEYGIDILRVQEIRGWDGATAIPNTPDYILGVISLRGIVIPIVDLRKCFDFAEANFDAATVVVVVNFVYEGSERVMGAVVDSVCDVYNFSADDINETPDLGIKISTEVVKGFAIADDKMIIILDIDKLIALGLLDNIKHSGEELIEELSGELDDRKK